jgi:diguanylate cyclase (GGDEF)-like protein
VLDARFDRAPCGLLTTTLDGVIVDVNATLARWLDRDADAVIGNRFTALLDAGSRLIYETRIAQVLHLDGAVDEAALSLAGLDGGPIPVLFTAALDADGPETIVRIALLPGRERAAYEKELARARRVAEASEARVRILQDISDAFGTSGNDQHVADTFVRVAREAFSASDAAVHLLDEQGRLHLVAGTNPLEGVVAPIPALRDTLVERVLSIGDVQIDFPELAEGLRSAHLEALSVTPLHGEGGRLGVLVCFFGRAREFDDEFLDLQRALGRQASQTLMRVRLQRELEFQALRDPLTGVLNSQSVEQRLGEAVRHAAETGEPVSVLFLDVDAFKSINDTFGHVAGDSVLRTLARRLTESVRQDDVVGRIGGDEFIAICGNADAAVAAGIGERILAACRNPIETMAGEVAASVSIGLASYDPRTDRLPTADDLLVRADGAMYVSKDAGKDRVSVEERRGSGA